MSSAIREWLNLGVRWFHVFAGIMWVGQTYYFTWLDGQFTGLRRRVRMEHTGGVDGSQRGVLHRRKQKTLGVSAEQVRWFRWEALMTWLAGMVAAGSCLLRGKWAHRSGCGRHIESRRDCDWIEFTDRRLADLRRRGPIAARTGAICFRDVLLGDDGGNVMGADACVQRTGGVHPCGRDLRHNHDRECLVPDPAVAAEDDCVAAAAGNKFDASLGAQAKLRSKHNTFMAVPVVFLMISNHYPVATYGNQYGWLVLVSLVVVGWVAAKIIREA